jgi:hypothetical protein
LGPLGSSYYVNNLSSTDLGHIFYDLDSDVTATPNYVIGILDPAAVDFFGRTVSTTFPANVYGPSQVSRDQSIEYFNSIGLNHELFSPVGTDAFNFNLAGIPASGMLTGQDCCKTQDEVNLFGGELGNYEGNLGTSDGGCVDNPFRWCDKPQQQRPERAHVHVEGVRQHSRPDGVRQECGGRKRRTGQAFEGEARTSGRHRRRPARHQVRTVAAPRSCCAAPLAPTDW